MATATVDDTVYVAVGKDVDRSKLTLLWALENFPSKKFCILHVHQPAHSIPLIGLAFAADRLEQHELSEFREFESKIMHKVLDDYLQLCRQSRIVARKVSVEMDDIGDGIVELVYQNNVKKLVMGAAADIHYFEGMMNLRSDKAKFVYRRVPQSCQVWYICKSRLILTRGGEPLCSSAESLGDSATASAEEQETDYSGLALEASGVLELYDVLQAEGNSSGETDGNGNDQLYNQLDQALLEVEKHKREAFDESIKRIEAMNASIKAGCRAKALERLYTKELKRRTECEEALAKEKEENQRIKNKLDEAELISKDQRLIYQIKVEELTNQITELQVVRDNALNLVQEITNKQIEEAACLQMNQYLSTFSLLEIVEATHDFDSSSKIGEGGYGNVYKGLLRHTPVAIKVLNQDSLQGPSEFAQEVRVLSKMRHPNLVTLIGTCTEVHALVYEYFPNGNLEDRLSCKNNTPPLPWQARIRIAAELCSALIFLHSSTPDSIVHGDLKPGNILLDGQLACKLGDFGICRALSRDQTLCLQTDPKGTFHYMDPLFLSTGELTPKSDVYSFGIILLQLLTGKPALGIAREIRDVIKMDENLQSLLDPSAGDWPFVLAKQLASVALKCCEIDRRNRPDLASEVWSVLEPIRASCATSSVHFGYQENEEPPPYFFCPITHEVMQDPQVAADGFTYEAEALLGWIDTGKNSSPMTNAELEHFHLIPNRSLRSAIQQWQQFRSL